MKSKHEPRKKSVFTRDYGNWIAHRDIPGGGQIHHIAVNTQLLNI